MGIPLLAGRSVEPQDSINAPSVVVVNSAMAKKFFPNESPLGKYLQLGAVPDKTIPYMQVIGIAGDVKQSLDIDSQAEMFVPYAQPVLPILGLTVALRTDGNPAAMTAALRSAVGEIDKDQAIVNVRTMEQSMANSVDAQRFRTMLLGLLAGLALVLAAIGVYGVMSYVVSRRTQEIGIRVAMGAQPRDVLLLIVGQGLAFAGAGILTGGLAALALTRLMSRFLFGVQATDPLTFVGVALMLASVAVLACYVPARRAMSVDPLVALRYE